MMFVRPNPASPDHGDHGSGEGPIQGCEGGGTGGGGPPNRLNLLLSCSSWRTDSWAARLPFLLEPMGIQSLRATSARDAERVIRSGPIHIAVVDLGIPLDERVASPTALSPDPAAEEGGTRILELLARMPSPPPTVVVQSPRTHRDSARCMNAALKCGAFAVVDRSAAEVEMMLDVMRRVLAKFYDDKWPGGGSSRPGQFRPPGPGGLGGFSV